MNDLLTDSFVGAAAQAQQDGGGSATSSVDHGAENKKLQAFLAEAEAAKTDMAALRDELSRLQSAHEASKSLLLRGPAAATQAALVRLLGSARRLRARLASMDRRAPAPAAHAAAGLRDRLQDLTAGVQTLRRQVSADRRADAARRYLAVAGEAPTEDQLDRLLVGPGGATATDEAMRAAMVSSSSEVEQVEGGLLELQQLFLDMAALVESQGPRLGDIERHVAAAAQDVGEAEGELREARRLRGAARRRKMWLAAGLAAVLLVALAVAAVVVALALARRGGGSNNVQLPGAGMSGLLDLPL